MKIIKKIIPVILGISLGLTLTGCKDIQIFETREDKVALKPYETSEMEAGKYYVKQGTKFYPLFKQNGSATGKAEALNPSRVMFVTPDNRESIPTHYRGEIIAYPSTESDALQNVTLERMKDLGYSIGVFGGKWNSETGTLDFITKESVPAGSDFGKYLETLESENIKISAINGTPLTKENLDISAGVITGLEKDKKYKISLYAGSYYHELDLLADTQMLAAFEIFNYGSEYISATQNGYMSFNTPDTLKSGYYIVNGSGLMRYYSHKKGEPDTDDMNESYYQTEQELLEAYSKQYSVKVPKRTKNLAVNVSYDTQEDSEETPKGYVFAPDGTKYEMTLDENNRRLSLTLAEAGAGDWSVNIIPSSLNILEVKVTDASSTQELTQEKNEVVLDTERENIVIKCYFEYINGNEEDEINGTVVGPDGLTQGMEIVEETDAVTGEEKQALVSRYSYAPAGTYQVTVNHYPTRTTVSAPQVMNNTTTDVDVIIVEE